MPTQISSFIFIKKFLYVFSCFLICLNKRCFHHKTYKHRISLYIL